MIDIGRSNNDLYYRYKMPRVIVKQEGKTGGIKTVVVNLADIASSLKRSPSHILKYISYELATQSKVDGNRYVVNGKHDPSRIQTLIYDFIDAFVMCPSCGNPETFYLDENGLTMECLACGEKSRMRNSKLSSVIMKDVDRNASAHTNSYFPSEAGGKVCGELRELLESNDDKTEEIYRVIKDSGMSSEEAMMKLLSFGYDLFRKCKGITKHISSKTILSAFEDFIEGKKEGELGRWLRMFEEEGVFRKSELFKYFMKPQVNRKRSPQLKKEVNEYFSG